MRMLHSLAAVVLTACAAGFMAGCSAPQQAITYHSDSSLVFQVQTVNPLNGSARQVTGEYQLRFSPNSLVADLPYFGRAYTAPVNPADGGIRLNTTAFTYQQRQKRKGWELVISPTDQREVQMMVLSVSDNGYGTLQVTSTNRQAISYYGTVNRANPVN